MRSFHTGGGATRPYFSDEDFDRIARDELATAGLLPSNPGPIRIERFIEKRFGVSPTYEALRPGLLGYTRFGARGVEEVVVASQLTEEGSRVAERRVNTTLAHEAGHGLLHTQLFVLDSFPQVLFDGSDDVEPKLVLCRDGDDQIPGGRGYDGRWWEFQANRMMGALLLPKGLVAMSMAEFLETRGGLGAASLPDAMRETAKIQLAEVFDVNPIVAQLRIDHLYPREDPDQLTL